MNVRAWLWAGLGALLAANLVVGAAWVARDRLVAAGWLVAPSPTRIDLPPQRVPLMDRGVGVERTAPVGPPPAAEPETPAVPVVPATICTAFGPFQARDLALALGKRIESAGGSVRLVEQAEVGTPDYLVYVEPAASRALAHRTWRELVGLGVDAFVIPRGERENGVSVGVFTRSELAVAQRDRVAELGFSVVMRTVRRSHTVYLLKAWDAPPHTVAGLAGGPCPVEAP